MKLMHTDNFGGDYPDEKFADFGGLSVSGDRLRLIADILNRDSWDRFWQVVEDDYKLIGGFEP